MEIKKIKADFSNLLQATGESKQLADELLNGFLESNNVTVFNYYDFELRVKSGGKTNVIYVAYASTNESPKGNKSVGVVQLKHPNFIQITISNDDLEAFYDGKFLNDIEKYLKAEGGKLDYSKIFGLINKTDGGYQVYMQYK